MLPLVSLRQIAEASGLGRKTVTAIASDLNVVVASVDYRLASEFPDSVEFQPLEACPMRASWLYDPRGLHGLRWSAWVG